jgi:phosphate transport system permease protein
MAVQGGDMLTTVAIADIPTRPVDNPTKADRVFRLTATAAASVSLIIVGTTLIFMIKESRPAFQHSGYIDFWRESVWNPAVGRFGVAGLLGGSLIIALVSMVISVPLGVAMALFINEYAPARVRAALTSIVDLLAALPSLIFGMWALFTLKDYLVPISHFISVHLSVVPFLKVDGGASLVGSSFIAGVVVALMVIPIVTSVSRVVMAQVPREQCEGALALGGTRWGMIREVILPFSRSGIVGASMLGFGRALGETIAVALIIGSSLIEVNSHVLQGGASSVAALIATHFGEAGKLEQSGLVAAGLALFLVTFAVNFLARLIVKRAR